MRPSKTTTKRACGQKWPQIDPFTPHIESEGASVKNEKRAENEAEIGSMPDDHFIAAKPHHVNKNRRFTKKMRSDNYKINLIYLKGNKYY